MSLWGAANQFQLRPAPSRARRCRVSPRVVRRAISKHRAKGNVDRAGYQATININVLTEPELTPAQAP